MAILKDVPADTVASLTERLQYTAQRVADAKTEIMATKGVKPLERALENAIESGNETMIATIQNKIANFTVTPVDPKTVTDLDVARAYIDTIGSARLIANFFGGDILEPVFDFLYFPIDWNTNNFGNQFAPGTLFLRDDLDHPGASLLCRSQPHAGWQLDLFDRWKPAGRQGQWRADETG